MGWGNAEIQTATLASSTAKRFARLNNKLEPWVIELKRQSSTGAMRPKCPETVRQTVVA